MRVGIYARVSTSNNGQDPTMQTRELREYCERRGWTVSDEYVDVGISGTKEKRPELDRLMAMPTGVSSMPWPCGGLIGSPGQSPICCEHWRLSTLWASGL